MPQINTLLNVQEALGKKRPFRIRYIGVAGGGGAASASLSDPTIGAGGGGGGGVITGSYIPEKDSVYPIVVGDGGAPETNGVDTVLFDTTAIGGGAGRRSNETGSNGGSGGGGGFGGVGLQPTASYTGEAIDEKYFQQFGNDGGGITQPDFEIEFLAVAGGGGGNIAATTGNGGGGGGVITGSFFPALLTNYDIIVGDGGAPGLTIAGSPPQPATGFLGQNTSLFGATALGGGGADGSDILPFQAPNGGSGGGGGGIGLQPTATYPGFGNNGATGAAAGGGGAGAAGSGRNGGNGIALDFTGTTVLYGPGGRGITQNDGPGSNGAGIYGNGGQGAFANQSIEQPTSGSAGAVIIKYAGVPKATGGTITENGGFTFHTYTSVGTGSFKLNTGAGGGGGAGEAGFDSDNPIGGNGGDGILVDIYSTPLKYGPGGAGFGTSLGAGTDGDGVYGAGGTAGLTPESGSAGVAIIKYESGIPRATGGTITQDNRFVYHLFETGSADFTWLG